MPVVDPNSSTPVPNDPALLKLTVPAVMAIPPPKVFAALRFTVPPAALTTTLPAVEVPP